MNINVLKRVVRSTRLLFDTLLGPAGGDFSSFPDAFAFCHAFFHAKHQLVLGLCLFYRLYDI
jgi:hypothetical protein